MDKLFRIAALDYTASGKWRSWKSFDIEAKDPYDAINKLHENHPNASWAYVTEIGNDGKEVNIWTGQMLSENKESILIHYDFA